MAQYTHHKPNTPALPILQLKGIATQLGQHFYRQDDPPADEIYVPIELVKLDDEKSNSYFATVRFITTYAERKVHSIRINFQLDPLGKADLKTIKYI